jgi:predicted nucleic acid-binding protein
LPKMLHKGEVEAISLAQELGADWVLIDERKASREAEGRGLRVAGTLGILE